MPRQNLDVDGKIGRKQCRVRKRRCSSSSSSSLVRKYRLKRAISVGKRGGSVTPVPIWRIMNSRTENEDSFRYVASKGVEKARDSSTSARQLAATLWEINGVPSPIVKRVSVEEKISGEGIVRKDKVLKCSKLDSMAMTLFDPFHCPVSEDMDAPKVGRHRRRGSAGSRKLLQDDCNLEADNSVENCLMEVDQTRFYGWSPCRQKIGTKNRLKDISNGLTTSKELLKVLSRICRVEESDSTSLSLVSAIKFELDRAYIHVNKLIQEQRASRTEIDMLLKQFEEEKAVWKVKEQDRIRSSITSIAGQIEIEKKLRQQTERLNKKLGKELAETKDSLSNVMKELEDEKRAREILEQVCDELAQGVGDDKAEVEELKRESEKVRKEFEKEREMLQLADILREERVQMKLSEAKYQFEEKNALLDKLRDELEAYLRSQTDKERVDGSPSCEKIKELEKYLRETLPGSYEHQNKKEDNVGLIDKEDQEEDDDSADSDLHSIELNVDDINKTFHWGDDTKIESRRNSVDKSKGRKSITGKSKKQNISDETEFANGIEWEFSSKQNNLDVFDMKKGFEFSGPSWRKETEDEIKRYNMIKDLRDHIVSGSKIASSKDLANASQNFSQQNISS